MKTTARRALRFAALLLLRARALPFAAPAGPLLIVAPHPDDECLGCAGLLLRHRRTGGRARIVFLTDGSASHPGHPVLNPQTLATRRSAEAIEAARRLGLDPDDLVFLGLPDGRLPHLPKHQHADAVRRLAHEIGRAAPESVFVTSLRDGSSEHAAARELVDEALAGLPSAIRRFEYLVWAVYSPRHLLRIALASPAPRRLRFPGLGPAKQHALAAHESQFLPSPPWPDAVQPRDFANAFSTEEEYFIEYHSR